MELLEKHIGHFHIRGQESLEKMLALAKPVSRKEIDKVTEIIGQKIPQTGADELKMYAFGFRAILWKSKSPYPKEYEKLGKKLTRQLIAVLEDKTSTLSGEDLSTYSIVLPCFGDVLGARDYGRLADLGEKVLSRLTDDNDKRQAEWTVKEFKKHAQADKK